MNTRQDLKSYLETFIAVLEAGYQIGPELIRQAKEVIERANHEDQE